LQGFQRRFQAVLEGFKHGESGQYKPSGRRYTIGKGGRCYANRLAGKTLDTTMPSPVGPVETSHSSGANRQL
jgi:hypothetical protein